MTKLRGYDELSMSSTFGEPGGDLSLSTWSNSAALLANDFAWVTPAYEPVENSDGGFSGVALPVSTDQAPAAIPAGSFELRLRGSSSSTNPVAAWELLNGDEPV
jgi:hypothetical protein